MAVLHLLGSFQLAAATSGDKTETHKPLTSLRSRRALAVLATLVLERLPVARRRLLELVWADREPNAARANLSWVLTYLDTLLPGCIERTEKLVTLHPANGLQVDVWRLHDGDPVTLLRAGELLEGFTFRESAEFELYLLAWRERLRHQLQIQLQTALDQSRTAANWTAFSQYADRLIELDPWSEHGYRAAIEVSARQQRYDHAVLLFERLAATLSAELDTQPTPATTALHNRIRALADRPRLHLPQQPTEFVGRETGITAVANTLRDPATRLVTLHAIGGTGKTRLAIEVGRAVSADFLDGIHFISLIEAQNPLEAITRELLANGTLTDNENPTQQLADSELLLILDNYETVAETDEILTNLLTAVPGLKLLITSRIRLNLPAETVIPIDGLSKSAALDLFRKTAARARPGIGLQSAEIETARHICTLVHGLPLAIELAASSLRARSIEAIATSLQRTLSDLQTTMRDVPPRQRSLVSVFEQSRLLLNGLQHGLAGLTVFKGGFSAEAAHAVTGLSQNQVDQLVNLALLTHETPDRYRMHPLIRQLSAEKQPPDLNLYSRHADHFANLLVEHSDSFQQPNYAKLIAAIVRDRENIEQLWQTVCRQQKNALIADLRRPLLRYIQRTGDYSGWARRFAEAVHTVQEPSLKNRLQLDHAHMLTTAGDAQNALDLLQTIAPDSPQMAAEQIILHASILWQRNEIERAHTLLSNLEPTVLHENPDLHTRYLRTHSNVLKKLGQREQAAQLVIQAVGRYEQLGWAVPPELLLDLAITLPPAEQHSVLARAVELTDKSNNKLLAAHIRLSYGTVLMNAGRLAEADRVLSGALSRLTQLNDPMRMLYVLFNMAILARHQGDLDLAWRRLQRSAELAKLTQNELFRLATQIQMGLIELWRGTPVNAFKRLTRTLAAGIEDRTDRAWAHLYAGQSARHLHDFTTANDHLTTALQIARENSDNPAEFLAALLELHLDLGDMISAETTLNTLLTHLQTNPLTTQEEPGDVYAAILRHLAHQNDPRFDSYLTEAKKILNSLSAELPTPQPAPNSTKTSPPTATSFPCQHPPNRRGQANGGLNSHRNTPSRRLSCPNIEY